MANSNQLGEQGGINTRDGFTKFLKEIPGDKLAVVDFFATWCAPCQKILPKITELEAEFADVVFLKVDIDENSETADYYSIKAVPTFILFRNGLKIERMQGADTDKLKDIIISHLGTGY